MEWISVDAEVPTVGVDVLVWHSFRHHIGSLEYDDEMDSYEWFIPTSGDWDDPTHWMLLPDAPSRRILH